MRIKTTIALFLIIAVLFMGLIWRCANLQILQSGKYASKTKAQNSLKIIEPCRRGMILDASGNQLAVSNIIYNVYADSATVKDHKEAAIILSGIIEESAHIISQKITKASNKRYSVIAYDITLTQKEKIEQANLSGIGIESKWKRYNPAGRAFAHVVGFIGADKKGLAGMELKYENILRGSPGQYSFIADFARRPISLADGTQLRAKNGNSLILTIDSAIQNFTYNALVKQYKKYQAEGALAIVMEPKTGAILSMVSLPDFEPQTFSTADPQTYKNRAITDTYEPGSIFKPIVSCIALEEGVVTKNQKIFCENGTYSGKGFGTIGEYNNHSYGDLDVQGILIHSSNIGMAKIGQKLGKERLYRGLKIFGFGRKTGIDLPGEDAGIMWPTKSWTGYSITRIPYGQEILVTAIQIVRAYCILANGGKAVKPHLIKAVVSDDGSRIEVKNNTEPTGHVVKSEIADWIVQKALVEVVKKGTGKKAALDRWTVFGKTGTANVAIPGGKGYDEKNYIASFVGGAPAEDAKLVVIVSIQKPKRSLGLGYTGGTVAGPVVKEILEKSLTYLE